MFQKSQIADKTRFPSSKLSPEKVVFHCPISHFLLTWNIFVGNCSFKKRQIAARMLLLLQPARHKKAAFVTLAIKCIDGNGEECITASTNFVTKREICEKVLILLTPKTKPRVLQTVLVLVKQLSGLYHSFPWTQLAGKFFHYANIILVWFWPHFVRFQWHADDQCPKTSRPSLSKSSPPQWVISCDRDALNNPLTMWYVSVLP